MDNKIRLYNNTKRKANYECLEWQKTVREYNDVNENGNL